MSGRKMRYLRAFVWLDQARFDASGSARETRVGFRLHPYDLASMGQNADARVEPTGHWQVVQRRRRRVIKAYWTDAEGKHGRTLGPAHVKDSGRRTSLGATVWRAGDGPKPSPEHLTPKDADARL